MSEYCIKPWPFERNETVKLYWISSPFKDEKNQMKITTVFASNKNSIQHLNRPWGELHFLKMGYEYFNGNEKEINKNLSSYSLSIKEIKNSVIKPIYGCVPKKLFNFENIQVSDGDLCYCFDYELKKYIIPCVEIVRAVAGTSPFFLNALLSSSPLKEYSTRRISDDTLYIEFSETSSIKFPKELITKFMVREYANFLYMSELKEWWKAVNSDFLGRSTANKNAKIRAVIPQLNGSFVKGWGIEQENTILLCCGQAFL